MDVKIDLEFTPKSPRSGVIYTESSFVRSSSQFTFRSEEIGIARWRSSHLLQRTIRSYTTE